MKGAVSFFTFSHIRAPFGYGYFYHLYCFLNSIIIRIANNKINGDKTQNQEILIQPASLNTNNAINNKIHGFTLISPFLSILYSD